MKYTHLDYPDELERDSLGELEFPRQLMSRDWIGAPATVAHGKDVNTASQAFRVGLPHD